MRKMNSSAIFILKSVSTAIKAKSFLTSAGIDAKIIKHTSKESGCRYGISVRQSASDRAAEILSENQITPISQFFA